MTTTDLRALRVKILTKVMGWTKKTEPLWDSPGWFDQHGCLRVSVPDPLTDLNDAFEAMRAWCMKDPNHRRARLMLCECDLEDEGSTTSCVALYDSTVKEGPIVVRYVDGGEEPLAICRALEQAIDSDKEKA